MTNNNKEIECPEKCCSPYRPAGLCPHSCHKVKECEECKQIMKTGYGECLEHSPEPLQLDSSFDVIKHVTEIIENTPPKEDPHTSWEEEFDNNFFLMMGDMGKGIEDNHKKIHKVLKKFINSLLSSEKTRVREEIETMAKKKFPLGARVWCVRCANRIRNHLLSSLENSK